MRNIAMNGTAQIKPPSALSDLFAADQPDPHRASEARSERVGCSDIVGIDDVAKVGRGQDFRARCAFAASTAIGRRLGIAVAPPLDMIWQTEGLLRHMGFGEPPRGRMRGTRLP
jgi:hypothetical protein